MSWYRCRGQVSEPSADTLRAKCFAFRVRGAPYHPQTHGKIERWHQTLKNRILFENYYLPGDLEAQIGQFVAYYNHLRYHESIANLTPADVCFGRGQTILLERERIKRQTDPPPFNWSTLRVGMFCKEDRDGKEALAGSQNPICRFPFCHRAIVWPQSHSMRLSND